MQFDYKVASKITDELNVLVEKYNSPHGTELFMAVLMCAVHGARTGFLWSRAEFLREAGAAFDSNVAAWDGEVS
jgi:hypothetical protein